MRGIGNENTTAGGDPGVAFHYDGVYIGRPIGTLFSAFDTERVEILRGPQGTLYGRNAMGGSINYITRKPGDELEGHVDVTARSEEHTSVLQSIMRHSYAVFCFKKTKKKKKLINII